MAALSEVLYVRKLSMRLMEIISVESPFVDNHEGVFVPGAAANFGASGALRVKKSSCSLLERPQVGELCGSGPCKTGHRCAKDIMLGSRNWRCTNGPPSTDRTDSGGTHGGKSVHEELDVM